MIINGGTPSVFCCVTNDGKLEFMDWGVAEGLAEQHRVGQRRDVVTATAMLAVAVREHVLHAQFPDKP